jgi:hypothetical protein
MIYVFAAINCEVAPLRHLESDDLKIIQTGIGKVNVAFAVGRIFPEGHTRSDHRSDVIINIGTCGAKNLNGLFLINKITDEATDKDYYPDMLRVSGLKEAHLITVDKVKADPAPDTLYDMEASAVYMAGSRILSPDRMVFIKVVSDNGDVDDVTEKGVSNMMSEHLPVIESLIERIRAGMANPDDTPCYDELNTKLQSSASMKVQVSELMDFANSLGLDGNSLFRKNGADQVNSRKEGKEVIARVRDELTSF